MMGNRNRWNWSGSMFKDRPAKRKGGKLKNLRQRSFEPGTCRGCLRPGTVCGQPRKVGVPSTACWGVNCLHCTTTGRCRMCQRRLPLPE